MISAIYGLIKGWGLEPAPDPLAARRPMQRPAQYRRNKGEAMMNNMMGGGMMWGMGLGWILVIVILLLAAAALIKYLFFSRRG